MECLRFLWKPWKSGGTGMSWSWAPTFPDKVDRLYQMELTELVHKRVAQRERERWWALSVSKPPHCGFTKDHRKVWTWVLPSEPMLKWSSRVICQCGTPSCCRTSKNWVMLLLFAPFQGPASYESCSLNLWWIKIGLTGSLCYARQWVF